MSEATPQIHRTVRNFAILTCLVALLPISIGSLVTTLKAGMAFADWPTSDGQNMFLYPWLNDLRHTDKFVEHGHRLAGILIGLVSIGLVVVTFAKEPRRWVRRYSLVILLAVIVQGLLGGMRVRLDKQVLAMIHSITGGIFFCLCFLFAYLTNRKEEDSPVKDDQLGPLTFALSFVFPMIVLAQYVLGGFFRHLGRMLHEHLAGAALVSILSLVIVTAMLRSGLPSLRRRGVWLAVAVSIQVSLGLGAWVTRLGLPSMGWVAVTNSLGQSIFCSAHTVGGMFLLATATVLAANLLIEFRAGRLNGLANDLELKSGLPVTKRGLT